MNRIKKGDTVKVIAGKNKGFVGKVLELSKNDGRRVIVEGTNFIKKHVKPNPQLQQEGGVVLKEASIDVSNVALYNPVTKKGDKVGFKYLEDGKKIRYFKSNGEAVDLS